MTTLSPHFSLCTFLARVRDRDYGFLSVDDLATLAKADPLRQVLIRWHEGRARVAAQDAAPLIEAAASWCVRDVSLPASDPVYGGRA